MTQKTEAFRKGIAEQFIKVLSEKELDWKKNWSAGIGASPVNAITGKKYRGLNAFCLALKAMENVENGRTVDNRWATFKQIEQAGWKVKKGSHGCKVEYWSPYDFDNKKKISWSEYMREVKNTDRNVGLIVKYYPVFNGQDIEGIPVLEAGKERAILSDDIIDKISQGMDVPILHDGMGRAFYRPSEDTIHLPEREAFFSSYDYASTALHELSHATGAAHRLHRDLQNGFGTEKYAYEELVAEISSCFMGEHLQIEQTAEHVENHKAYVQGWIQEIQEKPEVLIKAIRDAGKAANLLEFHAGILTKEEYQNSLHESLEVPQEQVKELEPEIKSKEEEGVREKMDPKKLREVELKNLGYKPTKEILKNMAELDRLTGKVNSVRDIHTAFKEHTLKDNPEADKLVQKVGKIFQLQEQMKLPESLPIR